MSDITIIAHSLAIKHNKLPKRYGANGYTTNCPGHDDSNGSLTLTDDNSKLLWHCKAGCSQETVTAAIQPFLNTNFRRSSSNGEATQKIYPYHNADGKLICEKIRYVPKGFAIRQPNGHGDYIWSAKGVDTNTIYQLPRVLEAIANGDPIYIAEGEKDCDSLAELGFTATCNIFGASKDNQRPKWTDAHAKWLKDAKQVNIFFDNDTAGRAHALAIAISLSTFDIQYKIVELPGLPDKGDISDWLAIGGTKEQLLDLIESAPFCTNPNTILLIDEVTKITSAESIIELKPEEWAEPVLFDKIDTPEISSECLPAWLATYIDALTLSAQVPSALPVMQMLAILGTVLQNKFEVSPYGDNYTEPLCIWTITVLPPASRKTAVVNALTLPLIKYERDEAKRLKPIIAKHDAEQKVIKKRIGELENKAAKIDDEQQREKIINEIAQLEQKSESPLRLPRTFTGDVTCERLQNLMAEHDGKMAVLSDEGGIFEVMAGLYTDGKSNIDVFLKAHSGSAIRVDRGSRTVTIDNPALSFGITVQPQIISEFSQGSKKRFRGIGTCARFLWDVPKSNIGRRNVAKRTSIPNELTLAYETGILNLIKISSATDQNGDTKPWTLAPNDEAKECWLKFAQYIESRQGEGGDLESIQDWTGKLPGAALRIAGLLHVAKNAYAGTINPSEYLIINKSTMAKVLDLCELLIEHARTAFGIIGADAAVEDAKFIFQWLTNNRQSSVKQRDLHRLGRFSKSRLDRVLKAVEILQERHIISDTRKEPTCKPTIVYDINPVIYKGSES